MYITVVICIDKLIYAGGFDLYRGMTITIHVHITILLLYVIQADYIIL